MIDDTNQETGIDNGINEETAGSVQESQSDKESDNNQGDDLVTEESARKVSAQKPEDESVERVTNWRRLREAKERAERERDEALRQLQGNSQYKREEQPVAPEFNLADDDLAEGKHLKAIKQDNANRMAQIEMQLVEQRIKAQFPDFESVVNQDTLGMLRDEDPELAESIRSNKNMHSQMVTAYKSIKRYGFAPSDKFAKDKEKAATNAAKPRPTASVSPQQGDSPLSRANAFADGFTPELAKQLWKEMQEIRKKA